MEHEVVKERREEAEVYRLRLPRKLYRDVSDIALVYDQSLNSLLNQCVDAFVARELTSPALAETIEKMRSTRAARAR